MSFSFPMTSGGGASTTRVSALGPYTTSQTVTAANWTDYDEVVVAFNLSGASGNLTLAVPVASAVAAGAALVVTSGANPSGRNVSITGATMAGTASPASTGLLILEYGARRYVSNGAAWLADDTYVLAESARAGASTAISTANTANGTANAAAADAATALAAASVLVVFTAADYELTAAAMVGYSAVKIVADTASDGADFTITIPAPSAMTNKSVMLCNNAQVGGGGAHGVNVNLTTANASDFMGTPVPFQIIGGTQEFTSARFWTNGTQWLSD